MKRFLGIVLVFAIIGGIAAAAFFFWPASLQPVTASAGQATGDALLARGKYLTEAADCAACHTAPGGQAFAGGLAFKLPFGTIYTPNITPDPETGIGTWSDAEFVRAMHQGIGQHGEDLYPAFPYASYALVTTDDVLAIRAYLATLQPVHQAAPANSLSFPFNQRRLMRGWRLLFVPTHPFMPDSAHDAAWNRGAYLATALAHCGECHTPRNLMFAAKSGAQFAGAEVGGLKAYNITPDTTTGIGTWSDGDIGSYLSTGHAEGHGGAMGTMAEAVDLSFRHMAPEDIAGIVAYLRSVPPQATALGGIVDPHPASLAAATAWSPPPGTPDSTGMRIFQGACASCHGWDGSGQQVAHAALRGARTVNDPAGTNLVRVVLNGSHIDSPNGTLIMPSFAKAYTDPEIAAVANYVIGQFGGKTGTVTTANVASARGE